MEITNIKIADHHGRSVLETFTRGCGCCEGGDVHRTKRAALASLKDYEDELEDELKHVRELRRTVNEWKD